jgi:hypothetical protein
MADFDPALMQKVFHIPERKRISKVQHYRQPNDLWAGLEIPKWAVFGHAEKPIRHTALNNRVSSDCA